MSPHMSHKHDATVRRQPAAANRHVNAIAGRYSLKVENLPKAPPPKGQQSLFGEGAPK